jgi:radical SAM protein with 4Fe4S-binding SPASM domain
MCRSEHIKPSRRRMSDDVFNLVARELFPAAELVDLRGWGESLILTDICEKIDTVLRYGARLRIVSNLSFRADRALDKLAEAQALVDVSLDTACADTLASVRGGAKLPLIMRNVKYLVERGMRDRLCLLTTVQRETVAQLPDLVDLAAEMGVPRVRLFPVTADDHSPLSLNGMNAQVDDALAEMAARAKSKGVRVQAGARLGGLEGAAGQQACLHPWAYCYVAYTGDIGFCDHLIGAGNEGYLVGNITRAPFHEIWAGAEMAALRAEHRGNRRAEAPRFKHCAWCYSNKFIDFEEVLAPELKDSAVMLA